MYNGRNSAQAFHEDMIRINDRLPFEHERRRVLHLDLQDVSHEIADDQLAATFDACPHLETVVLSGIPHTPTDRTIVLLAVNAVNLQGIDLSGCSQVTDVGVLELVTKSLPLQFIKLNGVVGLKDPCVSAIAKSCARLIELELCDLPLLSPFSVRDIWSFSRKLRTLRLARCPLLTDKAFPLAVTASPVDDNNEKPLPHRPISTWTDQIPALILHHTAENLRVLDLAYCKITDDAVHGIVLHAPKIQSLNLSGCSSLTNRALESICGLREHLDVLLLGHVSNITDPGVIKVARACPNLRCVDLAFCRNLTDLSVFELVGLNSLRRLSLVRVHKLTDIGIYALAEHATKLERLYLSYCDHISLEAIHLLLKNLDRLEHLAATGIPSLKRSGVHRFSDKPPTDYNEDQRAAFRVFTGGNINDLRRFLNKEEQRLREAEAKNIPFKPRSDDKLDLY